MHFEACALVTMWRLLLTTLSCSLLWLVVIVDPKGAAAMSPDGEALLDFKRTLINGDDALPDWNEGDVGPCEWSGVTCVEGSDESVAALSLRDGVGLIGDLSMARSLGSLPNLTRLEITDQKQGLTGSIPPEIFNATQLIRLDLTRNSLTGSIPAGISNLRNLTWLILNGNSLTGSMPSLEGLTDLVMVDVRNNHLSGPIPNVTLLRKLERLLLGNGNNLVATVGDAPDLANLTKLVSIVLSGCQIGGSLPTWIGSMRGLQRLDMSNNQLSGPIPPDIWSSNSFGYLDLSSNQLNGSIPNSLFPQLQKAHKPTLLNLSNNALTGGIPDSLNITPWPSAGPARKSASIDVSNNQLNGTIPYTFVQGELIERLWLHNNRLFGDITTLWANYNSSASRLSELQLQGNLFTGELGPATCARWDKLRVLDLSANVGIRMVNDSISFMLDNLAGLQELRLGNVKGTGKLPASNRTSPFTALRVLDLSSSGLEDDLSHSRLMVNAHFLFLSLVSLDLSGNKLRGEIPPSFGLMPNLTFLNLSNNLLSGRIPDLPPNLRKASFFAGNPGLCGPPLENCRKQEGLPLTLVAGLVACVVVLFAATCLLFAWRLKLHSKRHQQEAVLIAVLQSKVTNLMCLPSLRKATSNFSKECLIGVGGFGDVYKGKLNDGTQVAIKRNRRQGDQRNEDQFLNEVKILSQVNHRNLVQLLGCCLDDQMALLVFEFIPNGTLAQHLRPKPPHVPGLTWTQRLRIALQTADALAYLHSGANPPIFHRDVKSANILLDQNMNAKVADFGISKLVPLDATHVCTELVGTRGYWDPDYYVSHQLTAKSDVFSFGIVLLELISGRAPLEPHRGPENASLFTVAVPLMKRNRMEEIIDPAIFQTSFQRDADSKKVKESVVAVGAVAVKCLELASKDRPSMREVLQDLQSLWNLLDADLLDYSYDFEPGSQLSDLEDLPADKCMNSGSRRSFHSSSITRTLSSLHKLADISEQMASQNR